MCIRDSSTLLPEPIAEGDLTAAHARRLGVLARFVGSVPSFRVRALLYDSTLDSDPHEKSASRKFEKPPDGSETPDLNFAPRQYSCDAGNPR